MAISTFFLLEIWQLWAFQKYPLNNLDGLLFCSQDPKKKKKKPLILDVSRMGYKILHA
jgi:hypothetical protein